MMTCEICKQVMGPEHTGDDGDLVRVCPQLEPEGWVAVGDKNNPRAVFVGANRYDEAREAFKKP